MERELQARFEFARNDMHSEMGTASHRSGDRCSDGVTHSKDVPRGAIAKGDKAGKAFEATAMENEVYDDIYFDSDEEAGGKRKKNKNRRKLTNDELLYDPHMDDEDAAWVERRRRQGTERNWETGRVS